MSYKYTDAWGAHTVSYISGGASTGAAYNPFRYRGYYYDSDLGMYYLQSRYYDPVICRFINADGYVSTGQGILGYNMFAYCGNNPVMRVDPNGNIPFLLAAACVIIGGLLSFAIGVNIGTVIGSEILVHTNDVEPMDDDTYNSLHEANDKKGDTSNLSQEDQLAYVRKVRDNWEKAGDVQMLDQWSEAEMMRELIYHDEAYRVMISFDITNEKLLDRVRKVDYEGNKNARTYIYRFIGNLLQFVP